MKAFPYYVVVVILSIVAGVGIGGVPNTDPADPDLPASRSTVDPDTSTPDVDG